MWHSTIIGNVGGDAEMKTVGDGKSVLSFSVGIKTGRENTEWAQVSVWGRYGEVMQDAIKRGSRVTVVGKVTAVDAYAKSGGGFGKSVKISADSVEVHRGKEEAAGQQSFNPPAAKPQKSWSPNQQSPQGQNQWGAPPQQQQQQQQWNGQQQQQQQPQWGSPQGGGQNNDPIPF